MINLTQWIELINTRAFESTEYEWDCFGSNAQFASCYVVGKFECCAVFDRITLSCYQLEITDCKTHKTYTLTDPEYKDAYDAKVAECCDEKSTEIDLIELDDFLEKARAIIAGETYDTRILINLNFTDEEELLLLRAAHKMDVSLNRFVELALIDAIAEYDTSKYTD